MRMPAGLRVTDNGGGRGDAGYMLPTALLVVLVLATVAAAATTLAYSAARSARAWHDRVAAFYAAESGIEAALYRLREEGYQPYGASLAEDLDESRSYRVRFESQGGNRWLILSVGRAGQAERTVRLEVLRRSPVFPSPPRGHPPFINLSAEPGEPGYCESYEAPALTFAIPEPPPGTGPGTVLSGTRALNPGTYCFTSVDLDNQQDLTLNGPATVYVTGNLSMDNNASLCLSRGVTLYISGDFTARNNCNFSFAGNNTVYVGGSLVLDNNAECQTDGRTVFLVAGNLTLANNSQIGAPPAAQLLIYLTTDRPHSMTVQNNVEISAGIYAPTAHVSMGNNTNLTGALVAGDVSLGNNVELEYDQSLANVGLPGADGSVSLWAAGEWELVR